MAEKTLFPSERLTQKYVLYVVLIAVLVMPGVLLGLIPELGLTYALIYIAANLLWIAPSLLLLAPYTRSISYELGEEQLRVRKGILTKTVQTVPYRTITNVETKRGPFDRLLGLATIHVHTAGYSQQASAEASLNGLTDYEEVEREIYARLARARGTVPGVEGVEPSAAPAVAGDGASAALLGQVLGELQRIRALLEERPAP